MHALSPEIYEYFEEYLLAFEKKHFSEAIQIVEKCYLFWISKNTSPQSFAAMMTSMLVFALSGELMWMSHYSIPTSQGLILLTLSLAIITTQNSVSFFYCPSTKKKGGFQPRHLKIQKRF